jgi:threonine synthase
LDLTRVDEAYDFKLKCERCGRTVKPRPALNSCPHCGGLLEVEYDYRRIEEGGGLKVFQSKEDCHQGMWRYAPLLPHPRNPSNIVTMGEGAGSLIPLRWLSDRYGVKLFARYYGINPTGTHKDLGVSVAVSIAKDLGVDKVLTFSTGNAATSITAYCNRAGIRSVIVTRTDVSAEKLANLIALNATIVMVKGLRDPWSLLQSVSGVQLMTNFLNPYRAEGHKTLAYDIFSRLGEGVDFIIEPVGTGGGIWGTWKGYLELKNYGLVSKLPKLIGVQPEAVKHAVLAFESRKTEAEPFDGGNTIVQSLADPIPLYGDRRPLAAVYGSNGAMIAVSDEEVLKAIMEIGSEGLFVEPAAATTLAALKRGMEEGLIDRGDTVVLSLTGTGLKQPEVISPGEGNLIKVELKDAPQIIGRMLGGVKVEG